MVHLDQTEKKIVELLQRDGRMSFVDMAAILGVTEATIRRKFSRLVNEDLIRIVGIVDPSDVGINTLAMIALSVEPCKLEDVAREASALDEVNYLAVTTGGSDIVMQAYFQNNGDLSLFLVNTLNKIDGVKKVNTSLILDVCKQDFDWGVAPEEF